ncbi:hypothetical protein AB4Z45_02635 [Paenibacillus sp. MCAF9]
MNEQELIDNIVKGIDTLHGSSRISKINKGYIYNWIGSGTRAC